MPDLCPCLIITKEQNVDKKQKVLILEDVDADAALLELELKKSGAEYEISRAVTKGDFERLLKSFYPNIILFDVGLPGYDGILALEYAKSKYPEAICICVSGILDDERAVKIMKMGAVDYVPKKKTKSPEAICICVRDIWDDGRAVKIIKRGAVDYVQKKTLPKLTPAINR